MVRTVLKVVLLGLVVYACYGLLAGFVLAPFEGGSAVKDWDQLCRVEDCSQFPDRHMTFEVDGRRYYYPALATDGVPGNLFGVLPIGAKAREGRFRPSFKFEHPSGISYVNWRELDFEMYLETRADDTIRRGYGRLDEDTKTMRFGHGVLSQLPAYFGVDTDHPSGALQDFSFYIHSKNSSLSKFRLSHHLWQQRRYLFETGGSRSEAVDLKLKLRVPMRADLPNAGFASFNDAFWIVSQDLDADSRKQHTAVVSKLPILHKRHVYGICRSTCWFYSLKFSDDPENQNPLVAVEMAGEDMAVFLGEACRVARSDQECDPEKVNQRNIRQRFAVVEKVLEALQVQPTIDVN